MSIEPIYTHRDISSELNNNGYIMLAADDFAINPALIDAKQCLWSDFDKLEPDNYLKGGARFRLRRFANFYFQPSTQEILPFPHTTYFQDESLNSYAGGIQRKLVHLTDSTLANPFLHELIKFNFRNFPADSERAGHSWNVDVHQIRIVATPDEVDEPTPEGIHHDENDFICMHLVKRHNTAGGINTVYNNNLIALESHTLHNPMDSVIMWDPRVMHGVTPIRPQDPNKKAVRDMLLIGYNHAPDLNRPVN
jgi:hypothetical protein